MARHTQPYADEPPAKVPDREPAGQRAATVAPPCVWRHMQG